MRFVSCLHQNTPVQSRLTNTNKDGKTIIKGDDYTWLEQIVRCPNLDFFAFSVQKLSRVQCDTGPFILDFDETPWSCGRITIIFPEEI